VGGTRYAVTAGMGLLRGDGEGLGVTQVSSGGADDGGPPRMGSAAAQVPALPPEADRLGYRIYVLYLLVKGSFAFSYRRATWPVDHDALEPLGPDAWVANR